MLSYQTMSAQQARRAQTELPAEPRPVPSPWAPDYVEEKCHDCRTTILRGVVERRSAVPRCCNCRELRVCRVLGIAPAYLGSGDRKRTNRFAAD